MIRDIKTLADANIAIRELQDQIRELLSNVVNFKKRRIANASPSVEDSDYVTRAELTGLNNNLTRELTKLNTALGILEKRVRVLEP